METRISLALANKLRMLFETEDKFLTYPMGIGFDYRYLNFMKDPSVSDLSATEQLNNKGDFARLLNFVPQDSAIYAPDSSRFLWTEMKDVLVQAKYANSVLTGVETKQLNEALDFLTDERIGPDGTRTTVYSSALSSYYSYKTSYEVADKTYLDEKISVETTTGTEGVRLKQQWNAYREKQLSDFREKALQDWMSLGNKLQVEQSQATQRLLEPRKYLNLKGQSYLNDIALSEIADINGVGIGFCTTFFSPIDVFDKGTSWLKLSLTKEEINTLVQNAPDSLKAVFNPTGENVESIETISLEYNNVSVLRPWYHPEFFEARFWEMTDGTTVSDGNVPRKGKISSYVTSILAVRNLVITKKKSVQTKPTVLSIIGRVPLTEINLKTINASSRLTAAPISASGSMVMRAGAALEASKPAIAPSRSATFAASPTFVAATVSRPPSSIPIVASAPSIQLLQRNRFINDKYLGTTIKTPPILIPPKQADPGIPPANNDIVRENYIFDGVVVLAYVCKRIPRCPNPDKTLSWT